MSKIVVPTLVAMFLLVAISIFAVDAYFWTVNRYCRFHIGRWKDFDAWETAVRRIAHKWSKKTPTVKITDNSRYMFLDMLRGHYRSSSIQSWQNAAILLCLWEAGEKDTARSAASRFVDKTGNWRKAPVAVDSAMLAYAILRITDTPSTVKPAMDLILNLIQQNVDRQGLIAYTTREDPNRYVDTIGLVCPFLALYGRVYGASECEKLAIDQLRFYHDHGLLPNSSLPNHAIHGNSKLPLGVYGWGRGTAWYILGLMDTFPAVQNEHIKQELAGWIRAAADNYMVFQHTDGGFGSIIQSSTTYDSSATAVMAWFYLRCAELFEEESYRAIAASCINKLRSVTRINGKIDWCQGDTKGIGIFSQTYDIMPFAQGFAIRALNLYKKESLEWHQNPELNIPS